MTDVARTPVTYECNDKVALIRLDDGKANAITHEVVNELHAALSRAEDDGARAVVLIGRPGRFSAGFDLKIMQSGPEEARDLLRVGAELAIRIFRFPMPVVLGVTGHALAMGAILLMAADRRIAAAGDFKIGLNEVAIGMPLPRFATEFAVDRLSRRHLLEAVNLARIFDPSGAADAGFVDVVVDPDDVEHAALDEAATLASTLHEAAFRMTREHLREERARRVEDGLSSDVELFAIGD